MTFTKEHLLENGYDWSLGRNTRSMTDLVPSRNRFDRFNGYCMLHMLNIFDQQVANLSVLDGQHLESLIAKELPLELSSEISVFNWLKGKYVYNSSLNKMN